MHVVDTVVTEQVATSSNTKQLFWILLTIPAMQLTVVCFLSFVVKSGKFSKYAVHICFELTAPLLDFQAANSGKSTPLSTSESDESGSEAGSPKLEQSDDIQPLAIPGMHSRDFEMVQQADQGPHAGFGSVAQLLAVGNLHKQNDDRFDAITQALEQDLLDSPRRISAGMREGISL